MCILQIYDLHSPLAFHKNHPRRPLKSWLFCLKNVSETNTKVRSIRKLKNNSTISAKVLMYTGFDNVFFAMFMI